MPAFAFNYSAVHSKQARVCIHCSHPTGPTPSHSHNRESSSAQARSDPWTLRFNHWSIDNFFTPGGLDSLLRLPLGWVWLDVL